VGNCPICQGPEPFRIHEEKGGWQCYNLDCGWFGEKSGFIEEILAWGSSETVTAVEARLRRMIDPDSIESSAVAAQIPDMTTVRKWVVARSGNDEVQRYLDKHAISNEVADQMFVGVEFNRIKIPVFASDSTSDRPKIANIKTIRYRGGGDEKKKNIGLRGRSHGPWPWQHIHEWDAKKPIVITEGEPDAMALMSVGCNVITTTGGVGSLQFQKLPTKLFPSKGSREVILCMDNDIHGDRCGRKLLRALQKRNPKGSIRVIRLPQHIDDISEFLATVQPDERVAAWNTLVDESPVQQTDYAHRGIFENNGEICRYGKEDEPYPLAPFTGVVIEGGSRFIGDEEKGFCFTLRLTHKDISHGEIEVVHVQGEDLSDELLAAGGAAWSILKNEGGMVFDYICRRSTSNGLSYPHKKYGWAWGYTGSDRSRFITRDVIFQAGGSVANTEYRMDPEDAFQRSMRLPHPKPEQVRDGVDVLWEHAYKAHTPEVMLPLIIMGVMAPVRRLLAENHDNFFVLVRGVSEAGKTTRAKVAQCLYGDFWSHHKFPTFQDTPMALERRVAQSGDSYVLVDDLDYSKMKDQDVQQIRTWLQGTPQGGGRHRSGRDGSLMVGQVAHAIKIITCEHLPRQDQALLGRSIILEVGKERAVDESMDMHHDLTYRKRDLLPAALSGWLDHIFSNLEMSQQKFDDHWDSSLDNVQELLDEEAPNESWKWVPQASRIRGRLRLLDSFFHLFTEWCRSEGYLREPRLGEIREDWSGTMCSMWRNLTAALREGGVANQALQSIEGALLSGEAYLEEAGPTGHEPTYDYPLNRHQSAKKIGILIPIESQRSEALLDNVVDFDQKPYVLALHEGAGRIWGSNRDEWQKNKQYLQDNSLLDSRRIRRPVLCYALTTKSATRILMSLGVRRR